MPIKRCILPKNVEETIIIFMNRKIPYSYRQNIGVEALLRWDSHELGSVSPKKFIPIAEESGQIIAIGKWVLLTACVQMKKWQDAGMEPVPISVNISAVQFHQEDLVTMILEILHQNELEAKYLELEITESFFKLFT
jgi:EAL domain-containing protein (putative c-di-GMP-specific phosphodiesterase class I)